MPGTMFRGYPGLSILILLQATEEERLPRGASSEGIGRLRICDQRTVLFGLNQIPVQERVELGRLEP